MKITASGMTSPVRHLKSPPLSAVEAADSLSGSVSGDVSTPIPGDALRSQDLPTGHALPSQSLDLTSVDPLQQQRLIKYAGTSDPEALRQMALQDLGLVDQPLPDAATRTQNFAVFAERFFPVAPTEEDPFSIETYGPVPGTSLYETFAEYAQTDYGALMVQKVLAEAGDEPFVVKAIPDGQPQAWDHIMMFPPDFPPENATFKIGGQAVDPLAIIHHEFEHTRFGRNPQSLDRILEEEAFTVRYVENPVRILNGYEPRYTYTQMDAQGEPLVTLNILNPDQQRPGAWTFDPEDPAQLIPFSDSLHSLNESIDL